MQGIWIALLMKIIEYITSKEFIELVKKLVLSMFENDKKTGEEKRKYVLEELKNSGVEFSTNLINLGIESAVTYIKTKGVEEVKKSVK